uniref:N-acetyltransferase domain-containing protein n=1 Tax=Caenorhabditis tropicalis TaxID=1561998 RepID=A0A1I7UZA6_9PELO
MNLVINPPQEVFDQLVTLTSQTHGWAHQFYDYKYYKEVYGGFWFVAMLDDEKDSSDNFVCGGLLSRWDIENGAPLFGIGMFYCREEYRGKGFGKPVFERMMEIVGDANCVLTAAVDMSQKYADVFGFTKMWPYWHLEAEIEPGKLRNPVLSSKITTKDYKEVEKGALEAYDLTICPRDRKKTMGTWFNQNEVYTRVAFDSAHQIVGYCTIRSVKLNRLCAAPFYAESEEVAARLLSDTVAVVPGFRDYEKLIFWYPEINQGVERVLSEAFPGGYHIKKDFRTQFTKELIPARDTVVYSVACSTFQFV